MIAYPVVRLLASRGSGEAVHLYFSTVNNSPAPRVLTFLLLGTGVTPQKDTLHVGGDALCSCRALLIGEAGERMLRYHELEIRNAHHPGHGLGGGQENVGDNRCRGDAQALHLDTVVHTARTAGPSITYPGDQHVHLIHKFLDDLRLGGQRGRMLAKHNHVFKVVLLFENLG